MTSIANMSRAEFAFIFLFMMAGCINLSNTVTAAQGNQIDDVNFSNFFTVLRNKNDWESIIVGEEIFNNLEIKYRADRGFNGLRSKITAAEYLTNQMVSQLKKTTDSQMVVVADELFENKKKNRTFNFVPAKNFYETSTAVFSKQVEIGEIDDMEKQFLANFYDLKLRILTGSVARAGQALAIAEPSFKGTHNYVLVLPLLHASEQRPVNIDVLPEWMRQPQQLDIFSDSCLLHYGFAFHAMTLARESAKKQKKEFSQEEFYKTAAKKCLQQLPHIAVDCLQRAITSRDDGDIDEKIEVQFEIIQIWLDSGNYILAAGEAKRMSEFLGQHQQAGKAIWLYYYALSRANNTQSILLDIDSALEDPRCSVYRAKLMYIKWWALRRQKNQTARVAVLEHKLMEQYSNDPMIAPILLSCATDLFASQDYKGACELLSGLLDKFPSTKAAVQAEKMMLKVKTMGAIKEQ